MDIACQAPATIAPFTFLSYGTMPGGICHHLTAPLCDINATVRQRAEEACVGQTQCRLWPNTTTFGDPCYGTAKSLVCEVACTA